MRNGNNERGAKKVLKQRQVCQFRQEHGKPDANDGTDAHFELFSQGGKVKFKYSLDTTSRKFECPQCHEKTFVRYIDEYGQYIEGEYGRCDREAKCGYFLKPSSDTNRNFRNADRPKVQALPKKHPVFVPEDIFKRSLAGYERNNLFKWLESLFGHEKALESAKRYRLGTSNYFDGSTVFWYLNQSGAVTRGKIIAYKENGHRRKENGATHSVHALLKLGDLPELHFFGLHLLDVDKSKPVALCESEKSAMAASLYFPEFVWLATGSLSTLTAERMKSLKGRRIVLFPDGGCLQKWQEKADRLAENYEIGVVSALEAGISEGEREDGYDVADFVEEALRAGHKAEPASPSASKSEPDVPKIPELPADKPTASKPFKYPRRPKWYGYWTAETCREHGQPYRADGGVLSGDAPFYDEKKLGLNCQVIHDS